MQWTDGELAVAAAQAGAAVVRKRFGTVLERFDKAPGDFATAADIEAEDTILELLRSARPHDAMLAEESGFTGAAGDRVWMIDPLCGTLNFAAQTTLVATNVALRIGGEVVASASADPFTGEVFWADGDRAGLRLDGADQPLTPSARSRLVDVDLDSPVPDSVLFQTVNLLLDQEFARRFKARAVSTTLAVAWVAAGRRAGYVASGDLRDNVHFAAGIKVCQAAGCIVTGVKGEPLHTGDGGLIVAADEPTHTALLEAVARVTPAR